MLVRLIKITALVLIFMVVAGLSTYLTVHMLIRSQDTIVVPDLVGKDVVYALETLTDLELNTKVKGSKFDHSIPKHYIIAQDPQPGTEIKKGRDVRLIISKGARTVIMPNLIGVTAPQARIILEENGLEQGFQSHTYSADQPKDEIIAQQPQAGTINLRGSKVNLLISAGAPPLLVAMDNLNSMSLELATTTIEKYGLNLGAVQNISDPQQPDNTVIGHTPGPGYPVAVNQNIDLIVNRHTTASANSQRNGAVIFRYRVDQGFLRQMVRVRVNRPAGAVNIFQGLLKPSEEIWLLICQDAPYTLFLYVDGELKTTEHYD